MNSAISKTNWYTFKAPDKKRPVLILTRDSILDVLGEVTIAPITSTIRHIPSEVILTSDDGLPKTCAINLDHVQTVSIPIREKRGQVLPFAKRLTAQGQDSLGRESESALRFATWLP